MMLRNTRQIYLLAMITSLLISLATYYFTNSINPDGVLYLRVAQSFNEADLADAMRLYDWPFYSMLIGWLHHLFNFSYLFSAQLLNSLFQLGITLCFIALIKELGGTRRTLISAALVILLQPHLTDYRHYIIRDFGYWCFYLLALLFLIKHLNTKKIAPLFAWFFSMWVATLFRVEGLVFIFVIPLMLLFDMDREFIQRFRSVLVICCALLLMTLLGFVFLKSIGVSSHHGVGRIDDIYAFFVQGIQHNFSAMAEAIKQIHNQVLPPMAAKGAGKIFVTGLIGYFIVKLIGVTNIVIFALSVFAMLKGLMRVSRGTKLILAVIIVLNISVTGYFLFLKFFFSGRYIYALVLTLMLWAPFALDFLWEKMMLEKKRSYKILMVVIALVFFVFFLKLVTGMRSSHQYLKQGAQWFVMHATDHPRIITNSQQVLYYTKGNTPDWNQSIEYNWKNLINEMPTNVSYYLIVINHKNLAEFNSSIKTKPVELIKSFKNSKKDHLYIFKVKH